jgi:hypothetical protein
MKSVLDLRPVYHRLEDRIRAHVLLCWLALLLAGSPRPPPAAPGRPSAPTWTGCTPPPSPARPARSGRPPNSPRPNATCSPLSTSTRPRRSSNSPQASYQHEHNRLVTRLLGGRSRVSAAQPPDSCTRRPSHLWNPGRRARISEARFTCRGAAGSGGRLAQPRYPLPALPGRPSAHAGGQPLARPARRHPVAVADWAFRAFGNDPDLSAASPTAQAPSDIALVARAYRLMGHRPLSVGDVIAVAIGSGRQWLACDPTGWRPVLAPAHLFGVPLSDHPFGPSLDGARSSGRRS